MPTLTDCCDDTLEVGINLSTGNLELTGSVRDFEFEKEQSSDVRVLRDTCNEFLGEKPQATTINNFSAPLASHVSFNEGLLRLAAVHGKTVTFRYAKGDGSVIETRTLKPEDVQEVAGHVTFTGYDPDRDEPRAYRVDRMKGEVSVA